MWSTVPPMPFATIRGHEPIIAGLRSAWERERVAHAYLFAGPPGVGKRLAAVAFFQLLSCKSPGPGPDACGECRPCRLIGGGTHPDLLQLVAEKRSIKIDQVRDLTRTLRFPPVEAKVRGILIHDAETLLDASANALLKTLEEPSPRNTFVLLTAQPNALLATIRSRCQQVRFGVLPRGVVAEWLQANHQLDATSAHEVAAMSGGSFGAAEDLMDPRLTALRREWLGVLGRMQELTPTELLGAAETLAGDRESIPPVLDALRIGLRDSMLRSAGVADTELTFPHRRDLPPLKRRSALAALGELDEAEEALKGNVNPRMIGEHLLLGLRQALLA